MFVVQKIVLSLAHRPRLLRHPAVRVAFFSLGAAAVVYALASSWGELNRVEWRFNPLPLGFAFACLLSVTFGAAALWVLTCRAIGGRISFRDGGRIVLVSNLGKYL